MARITVEDCLKRVTNRFLLVNTAARRVRQIREGSEYLVSSPKNEDIVVALREIAAGNVILRDVDEDEVEEVEAVEEVAEVEELADAAEETETQETEEEESEET